MSLSHLCVHIPFSKIIFGLKTYALKNYICFKYVGSENKYM